MYAYDATNKCFVKRVATKPNRPMLVFYAVNIQMYWISNKQTAFSLAQKTKSPEHKINSTSLKDSKKVEEEKASRAELFSKLAIKEDVMIEDFMCDHIDNCIIIYHELDHITEIDPNGD